MTSRNPSQHRRRIQAGFTLVEVLVVVAIIGMLSSIAVPALQRAMRKSKRNAAVSNLRVLRDALQSYAADTGAYPWWDELDPVTLDPLVPAHIKHAEAVQRNFAGHRLEFYIPWNIFDHDWDWADLLSQTPQSYTLVATLAYDRSIRFIMTDSTIYYWVGNEFIPVGDD